MVIKIGSSLSCVLTSLSSTFQSKLSLRVSPKAGLIYFQQFDAQHSGNAVMSCRFLHEKLIMYQRRPLILFAISGDQDVYSELEPDASGPECCHPPAEDVPSSNILFLYDGAGGKPGILSFYTHPYREKGELIVSIPTKKQSTMIWLFGPAVLATSFIFPFLYSRGTLSIIFQDFILTDFLGLFFTEATFYCGVAVFLFLIDRLRWPIELVSCNRNDTPLLGHRILSVALLVLCLTISTVTMRFVWPWTSPAASATLMTYLVGVVVQFAFEQYARYCKSHSRPVFPSMYQVRQVISWMVYHICI